MKTSIDELLQRLLHGDGKSYAEEELKLLEFYFSTEQGKQLVLDWFERQSMKSNTADADYELMFSRIVDRLGFEKPQSRKVKSFLQHQLLYKFQKVAALLFIPLLLGITYLFFLRSDQQPILEPLLSSNTTFKEYYSPAGSRLKVLLPDSTEVWLNGSSSLKISDSFGRSDRNVELNGEGNFHVRRNDKLFFTVTAGGVKVKATGTVFNINAYTGTPVVETVLISGKVEVQAAGRSDGEVLRLAANQRAIYNKESNVMQVSTVTTSGYKAWPQGRLIFDNKSIVDVAAILEHWYNVKIALLDEELKDYRFSADLEECSLEQLLRYMSYSSPIVYSINKNKVTIKLRR